MDFEHRAEPNARREGPLDEMGRFLFPFCPSSHRPDTAARFNLTILKPNGSRPISRFGSQENNERRRGPDKHAVVGSPSSFP